MILKHLFKKKFYVGSIWVSIHFHMPGLMSATVTVRDLCPNAVAYHGRLLISFGEASKRSTLSVALRGFRRRAGRAFP